MATFLKRQRVTIIGDFVVRKVNPRALEFIGKRPREERRAAGIAFGSTQKKKGPRNKNFDSID